MAHRELAVIGAIRRTDRGIQQVLGALPADLDAALLIVLHSSNHAGSLLPQILQRSSKLPVGPCTRQKNEHGMVYIAPPD
jgi:two-component system, chemotaxis family, protein-glutamate methylesterase/glutaminase